jgi:hypothetical protein
MVGHDLARPQLGLKIRSPGVYSRGTLRNSRLFFALVAALLVTTRLCHLGILWEGDSYPLAAAGQMLHGKALYREIWFDKPPLLAVAYLLFGAAPGWPLRLFDAAYAFLACWIAWRFARDLWSEAEAMWAAGLLAFFLCFDIPSGIIPVASDLLMLAPHLAAVWLAFRRRAFLCGLVAGVAFWINPKGAVVAVVCAFWFPAGIPLMAAGFAAVSAAVVAWLAATGALGAYWEEVWHWGQLYASRPFVENPLGNGFSRTVNWAGFHAALVIAAGWFVAKTSHKLRWVGWLLLAIAGVAAGMRFFPRYYFLLLPVLVMMAARGLMMLGRKRDFVALLLLIPLTRFGPTYIRALTDAHWRDTAMDRDSRAAAAIVRTRARPGNTLFVWGYRPELYPYTRLPAGTMYLDSQMLTGVPADRHLTQSEPVETETPRTRREALVQTEPTFVIDGLGSYNPRLAITRYPDLRAWLSHYRQVARTYETVIYERVH